MHRRAREQHHSHCSGLRSDLHTEQQACLPGEITEDCIAKQRVQERGWDGERTTPALSVACCAPQRGTALPGCPKFERGLPCVSGSSGKPFPILIPRGAPILRSTQKNEALCSTQSSLHVALVREPFSPCTNKDHSDEKPLFTSMTWSLLSRLLFPPRLSFKRLLSKIEELQSALKKKNQKKKEHCGPAHATINHTRQSRSLLKPKQALSLISLREDKW